MSDQFIETLRVSLWKQFGAAIDMLEKALVACPDSLWSEHLWNSSEDSADRSWIPPEFSSFWYIMYHTVFWLDLYIAATPEEKFTPPAPFIWTELDPAVSPEQPYTKEELSTYLVAMRRKCHDTLFALTEESAQQVITHYLWTGEQGVSLLEVYLYTMRHVQEHVAQLNLFLGLHGIPDEALDAVARARDILDD